MLCRMPRRKTGQHIHRRKIHRTARRHARKLQRRPVDQRQVIVNQVHHLYIPGLPVTQTRATQAPRPYSAPASYLPPDRGRSCQRFVHFCIRAHRGQIPSACLAKVMPVLACIINCDFVGQSRAFAFGKQALQRLTIVPCKLRHTARPGLQSAREPDNRPANITAQWARSNGICSVRAKAVRRLRPRDSQNRVTSECVAELFFEEPPRGRCGNRTDHERCAPCLRSGKPRATYTPGSKTLRVTVSAARPINSVWALVSKLKLPPNGVVFVLNSFLHRYPQPDTARRCSFRPASESPNGKIPNQLLSPKTGQLRLGTLKGHWLIPSLSTPPRIKKRGCRSTGTPSLKIPLSPVN